MREEKSVYKALFSEQEVELESRKVELGIIDDLKKINSSYFTDTDSANSIIKGLLSDARRAESKIEAALKNSSKMPSFISKVEKSAKEIGVDVSNISELKSAKIAVKESKEYSKALSIIKKLISSL